MVAPETANQDAVTFPSARVMVTEEGGAGGELDCAAVGADIIRKTTASSPSIAAKSAGRTMAGRRVKFRFSTRESESV